MTPIAIIGIGCRFPGADDPRAFWRMLRDGADAITEVPPGRWDARAGESAGRWGGFVKEIEYFDASFFGVSDEEATAMDPQQRMMLEAAWTCLEDAAVAPQSLAGSDTGVFVGLASLNYGSVAQQRPATINRYTNTGSGGAVAANRISYFFDLRGPSFAVDAACASSLLSVHLACQSIDRGECGMALAGGVNAVLLPGGGIGLSKNGLLSPEPRCRVFDAGASGTVRGEGAGVLLLKPLDKALADADPVYAVIRGTAVTQNGRSNGIGGPSRQAQEAAIREAYRRAGIEPGKAQYVEAHSTATIIGDATELAAFGGALKEGRAAGAAPCAVGSVKSNIGHLEAAAGVAALAKVALMLEHERLVPTLHFQRPNPYAKPEALGLTIQTSLEPWPDQPGGRVAGVSASGYAGCNVHVVLTEVPAAARCHGFSTHARSDQPPSDSQNPSLLRLTLSAKTAEALRILAARYATFVKENPHVGLHDICATAAHGRARMSVAMTITAPDRNELLAKLESPASWQAAAPDAPVAGRRIHGLPTHPFDRKRYWIDDWFGPHAEGAPRPTNSFASSVPREVAVAPTDETETRLLHLWESVLGVRGIGTRHSFFDLGGTSVMALKLFDAIEREFGRPLPLAELYSAPTVAQLAALIRKPAEARRWETVVGLNTSGARPPLFFVPGLGGHAFELRALAKKLGEGQPVYVMHPQGLDPNQVPLTRIEEMAAAFIRHMKAVQPLGPYRLAGYSFGGSVAFEMARQLEAGCELAALVALLDAYSPEAFRKKSVPRRLATHVRRVWGLEARHRRDYLRDRLVRVYQRFVGNTSEAAPPHACGTVIDAVQRITDANQQAWRAYRPGTYGGRVVLFRASPREESIRAFCDAEPTNGWNRYAAGGVDVVPLPCDHLSIFEGAALDFLADRLRAYLAAAAPQPAPSRRAG